MNILYNHVGYERFGRKISVIESADDLHETECQLIERSTGQVVYSAPLSEAGRVDGWKGFFFWTFDFTDFTHPGCYVIRLKADDRQLLSDSFQIADDILLSETVSDVLSYFKIMRSSGRYDRVDRDVPFYGGKAGTRDLHGGWYDASGDTSKYLSHLSYANFMNPQQIPLVVWNLYDSLETLREREKPQAAYLEERIGEEVLHGADFLVRMQDDEGYFYMTLFDQWSKESEKRMISAFSGQDGRRSSDYQAGYRQGGGMAIAALARISRMGIGGDYSSDIYLKSAERGFAHLEVHNLEYLNDGCENIIDDYCALLAACELYDATGAPRYKEAADRRAANLIGRLSSDERFSHWWRADANGEIPFFHASDAGMPVVSLLRYLTVFPGSDSRVDVERTLYDSLSFELSITKDVVNPFGYARQYVKPVDGEPRASFFIPHDNWSGYWWQGENARLASLACAAFKAADHFQTDVAFSSALREYGRNQLNWILGCNPFDVCMLHGFGRNNPEYDRSWPNYPGGIVNGITSDLSDESDIAFLPEGIADDGRHRWRWSEQWLPHAAWYFSAVCSS